jgi:hypothetical protein
LLFIDYINLFLDLLITIQFVLNFFFEFHLLEFDLYINFDPYSFDCYFFYPFLNWIFFIYHIWFSFCWSLFILFEIIYETKILFLNFIIFLTFLSIKIDFHSFNCYLFDLRWFVKLKFFFISFFFNLFIY